MQPEVTSKHLEGIVDLTLTAPIKPGLVDSMDTRTYESRLITLLRTLNTLRVASREHASIRPFSETVERIQSIESFRLTILPDRKLLLAVTFDHAWEPYIRKIWWDLGTLLDVIFCNCEGYVTAFDHTLAEYVAWIRKSQVDTEYFYATSALTVSDLQYLRQTERLHREQPPTSALDADATRLVFTHPEAAAQAARHANLPESVKQGLAGLSALYKLTELYPAIAPGGVAGMDGKYLLRATHELLKELRDPVIWNPFLAPGKPARLRFGAQLEWFEQPVEARPPLGSDRLVYRPGDVQGGIVSRYPDVSHGALLLIRVDDPAEARAHLAALPVHKEGDPTPGSGIYVNVAFTCQGLRKLGVPGTEIASFPKEFREGMEARAGLLGDLRSNHPRNWALPERNWPSPHTVNGAVARVQLSSVDVVIQLRVAGTLASGDHEIAGNAQHPLYAAIGQIAGKAGIMLLSVQPMVSYREGSLTREHFGFIDGISQPQVTDARTGDHWDDAVKRGELLLGYRTQHQDPPSPAANVLLDNGTFLVVRKLRQDVKALNDFLAAHTALPADELKAKMMGRTPDGAPLVGSNTSPHNDFDYAGDPGGDACPFQSHIRRANPRTKDAGHPVPRIMRRGMSYGPRFGQDPDAERGIVFMAYAASIAEQFEVIQRWLTGGNSSGTYSGTSDPICGVPQTGNPGMLRFLNGGTPHRVALNAANAKPFVRVEWGTYLFVPSLAAIAKIAAGSWPPPPRQVDEGEAIIKRLLAMEGMGVPAPQIVGAWKAVLEDTLARLAGVTPAVWAAIRARGGVLKTSYGVLVGSKDLVMNVYDNNPARYSVAGYQQRMVNSIGPIYLGLDDGAAYQAESAATNAAIGTITEQQAFELARAVTTQVLTAMLAGGREVTFDVKELSDRVLGVICNKWFDIPDGTHVKSGGWDASPTPARCPGHFTSPSRYFFQPNPGAGAKHFGDDHGQSLRAKVTAYVHALRTSGQTPAGPISKAIFNTFSSDDQCARTIVGVMMGFLPTVDGNLRATLYEWLDERKTLWPLQDALIANGIPAAYAHATAVLRVPLMHAMQRRPVPDYVWRTATVDHDLGGVAVKKDDRIVVGIISATAQDLENGTTDVFAVFGGDRSASGHPTHACPAYKAAMGVLMGMLTGLLEAGTLRPSAAPLTITLVR